MNEKNNIVLVIDDERDHADGIVEALEKLSVKAIFCTVQEKSGLRVIQMILYAAVL